MKDGAQAGPATTEEIKNLITSGAIKADTMVWREGMAAWAPANAQSDFTGVAAPAAPPPAPAAGGGPGVVTPAAADVEKNKVMGVLAYLGILFLVPLLAAKDSPFARYHTNQGLVLFLAAIAGWIAVLILDIVLVWIPVLGWLLMMLLHIGMIVGVLVLAVMGIINAANGVCKPLPLIGNRFTLIK